MLSLSYEEMGFPSAGASLTSLRSLTSSFSSLWSEIEEKIEQGKREQALRRLEGMLTCLDDFPHFSLAGNAQRLLVGQCMGFLRGVCGENLLYCHSYLHTGDFQNGFRIYLLSDVILFVKTQKGENEVKNIGSYSDFKLSDIPSADKFQFQIQFGDKKYKVFI